MDLTARTPNGSAPTALLVLCPACSTPFPELPPGDSETVLGFTDVPFDDEAT